MTKLLFATVVLSACALPLPFVGTVAAADAPPVAGGGGAERPDAVLPDLPHYRGADQDGVFAGELAAQPAKLWERKVGRGIAGAAIAVGGRLIVGTDDGHLLALSPTDASTVWDTGIGGGIAGSPAALPGRIVVATGMGTVVSVDPESGAVQWTAEIDGEIVGGLNIATTADGAGVVVVGSHDFNIYGFDAADGQRRFAIATDERINGAPATGKGLAVAGGCDAALHVIDVTKNDKILTYPMAEFIPGSVSMAGGQVFAAYGNPNDPMVLACVDIGAEKTLWEYQADSPIPGMVAATAERVLFGIEDGFLACVDRATGKEVWKVELGGAVYGSPIVVGDKVVVGADDGKLSMLSLADGSGLWSYTVGPAIYGSPSFIAGVLYLGDSDGNLFAFR